MTASPAPARPSRATLGIVFATVFLDLLGFGLIIPIQSYYAESFGARPAVVTLIGAAYSLMQFVFMPFWGRLSDRIGRRPVMLFSIFISLTGFTLFAYANSLWMLFAARMLAGFGNANIGAAQAVIADSTGPEDRAKGMGMIGMAFGLGFVIGPAVGGTLGQISLAAPALAAAGLAAANWVWAFFMLPETRKPGAEAERKHHSEVRQEILSLGQVRRLMVISLVITTGFALMEQVLAMYIERAFVPEALVPATAAVGHKTATKLFTYTMLSVGLTMAVVQGGLIGRLARKYGEAKLISVGSALLIAGMFSLPVLGETGLFPLMVLANMLLAVGSGITTPSVTGLLSRSVGPDRQGAALGLGQSMSALGRVLGPAAAGLFLELGLRVPFWVGGLLVAVGLGVARGLKQPEIV